MGESMRRTAFQDQRDPWGKKIGRPYGRPINRVLSVVDLDGRVGATDQ